MFVEWRPRLSACSRMGRAVRMEFRESRIRVGTNSPRGTRLTATKRTDREATHARLYHIACPRNRLAPNALGFHRQQLSWVLKEAVWIINRFDPVRLQRIQRDLSNGIVVVP